jgi:hypothetical protein
VEGVEVVREVLLEGQTQQVMGKKQINLTLIPSDNILKRKREMDKYL